MSLGRSLLSLNRGLVGKDFKGDSVGNLERKRTALGSAKGERENCKDAATMLPVVSTNMKTVDEEKVAPVQMIIVLKVLCTMASLNVFNDMSLEELPE